MCMALSKILISFIVSFVILNIFRLIESRENSSGFTWWKQCLCLASLLLSVLLCKRFAGVPEKYAIVCFAIVHEAMVLNGAYSFVDLESIPQKALHFVLSGLLLILAVIVSTKHPSMTVAAFCAYCGFLLSKGQGKTLFKIIYGSAEERSALIKQCFSLSKDSCLMTAIIVLACAFLLIWIRSIFR